MKVRNVLAEVLCRLSDWLRERAECLADGIEDLSEWLYSPEADAPKTERK